MKCFVVTPKIIVENKKSRGGVYIESVNRPRAAWDVVDVYVICGLNRFKHAGDLNGST